MIVRRAIEGLLTASAWGAVLALGLNGQAMAGAAVFAAVGSVFALLYELTARTNP